MIDINLFAIGSLILCVCCFFLFSFRNFQLKITEDSSVEDFHYRWRIMEQAWLYPQGRQLNKEFNQPVPEDMRDHYVGVGQNFHVPTVSIGAHFQQLRTRVSKQTFIYFSIEMPSIRSPNCCNNVMNVFNCY